MTDKTPNVTKAFQYVEDVLSGKEPACRWVRLACQRHKNDMLRAEQGGFRWVFDPVKAERPCKVVELLPHTKGKWAASKELIHLEPWEAFIICSVFGWVDRRTGFRRFREVFILIPRKNGKSLLTAGVGVYMLAYDNENGAEIYCNATTEKQAWEVFNPAKTMVANSPNLMAAKGIRVNASNINIPATNSKFEPVIGKPGDGSSPSFAAIDEYHQHDTSEAHDTMITGMGARDQPILWIITTAGDNLAGPCYNKQLVMQDVLSGAIEDERSFALIYTLDSAPYDAHLSGVEALKFLVDNGAQLDEQWLKDTWLEICQEKAVTLRNQTKANPLVPTTRTDSLRSKDSANIATTKSYLEQARPEKKISDLLGENTPTRSQTPYTTIRSVGGKAIENTLGKEPDLENTDLLLSNTTSYTRNVKEDAPSAKWKKTFAWITATAEEMLGDCFAGSATRRLAFLEIAKRASERHWNICKTQAAEWTESGLKVSFPADDWADPASLRKANPNMGVSVGEEYLLDMQQAAIRNPRDQGRFKTKHLNMWVNSRQAYFNVESWAKCPAAPPLESMRGMRCWIALDLASKVDLAALEMLFPLGDGHYARYGKVYLPEFTVEDPKNAHYQQWREEGLLDVTDGNIIDYSRIEEDVLDACKKFAVADCCYDPFQATYVATRLMEQGVNMVEYRQTIQTMSDPMKTLDSWIIGGKLHHNCGASDPMTWQIGNVVSRRDNKDNVYPVKEQESKKIDSPVALIMCVGRATLDTGPVRSPYESRGLLVI